LYDCDYHQGAARDAASIHFRPVIVRVASTYQMSFLPPQPSVSKHQRELKRTLTSSLASINQSINQSVTCITAPLFVLKAASRKRRDESRNQLKPTVNRRDLRCLVNWDTARYKYSILSSFLYPLPDSWRKGRYSLKAGSSHQLKI